LGPGFEGSGSGGSSSSGGGNGGEARALRSDSEGSHQSWDWLDEDGDYAGGPGGGAAASGGSRPGDAPRCAPRAPGWASGSGRGCSASRPAAAASPPAAAAGAPTAAADAAAAETAAAALAAPPPVAALRVPRGLHVAVRASPLNRKTIITIIKFGLRTFVEGTANLNARADLRAGARVRHARRRPALCAHWTTPAARRAPGKKNTRKGARTTTAIQKGSAVRTFLL
jgi:hypothetical protein